jgi:6-phosphogluconolactonase (cycloisomerase 2 family)
MHLRTGRTQRGCALALAAAGVLAAGGLATAPEAFAAPPATGPSVGHVYVNDNTAGVNTVAIFNRHADGTLTAKADSPVKVGGAGTGVSTGSQGAIQTALGGRYLLAVDAGSDQISVLRIEANGELARIPHGLVSSGGSAPVSLAVSGHLVYVANAGPADTNYTGFRLSDKGRLVPIPGSTVSLPSDASPGDVLFNRSGANLVGTRVGTSQIDSFSVGRDGRLTAAAGSPYTAQGLGPFGSEFRPTNSTQLFVSNAHDGPGNGTVSAFRTLHDGTLKSIGSSPFPDFQTAPCWVEITHDGRFLFTVNTAVGTISRYSIATGGSLTLLGSTRMNGGATLGSFDARLSPDGRNLYVVDSAARAVSSFAVQGGELTELPGSPTPLPADATGFGVAVN